MSFNNSIYVCSLDNAELIDIYDPSYDDDDLLRLPENFNTLPLEEQETLKGRHETLVETLDKLQDDKKNMYLSLISERDTIILVCPICKKVYDSKSMVERELYHSSGNQLPVRKPKRHGVISDDRESIENATHSQLDYKIGARQIFLPNPTEEETNKQEIIDNRSVFKLKEDMKTPSKIKHARNQLENLVNKYGKEYVNVQINVPD